MPEARIHDLGARAAAAGAGRRDDAQLWAALAAAKGAADFCRAWLALQCARTPGATDGMVLLEGDAPGTFAPAAAWPAGSDNVDPLRLAAERALTSGRPAIEADPDRLGVNWLSYPIASGERVHGAVVLAISGMGAATLQETLRELHWGVGWILTIVWQHRAEVATRGGAVSVAAMDLLAVVQEQEVLHEAALALCNEISRTLGAEQASVGAVRGQSVKLLAVSHAAWFRKRSEGVEAIEAAMDEAYDQQATITHVSGEAGSGQQVTVQHQRLAGISDSGSLISAPLVDRGRIFGVLTLQRQAEAPSFDDADRIFCEAVAGLVAPLLVIKQREARLISGRIRGKVMDGAKALFGPRRPFAKALGIAAVLFVLFMLVPIASFRVNADAALEGRVQRAAAVPFSGFISRSVARAGDVVKRGQLLATLDDRDLNLDHARALGQVQEHDRRYREALAKHERAEMNQFGAQLRQSEAELRLIEYKLARVNIVAPIDGVLVSGDVSQLVGSPVKEGEVLFEVAPLNDFRVALQVPEGDISYLRPGQKGSFAPTGLGGRTVPFTVSRLTSVTANTDGKNTFRVEAELTGNAATLLRPGMEGVAKVGIDRRSRLWIWTKGMREWLRLFLWKWAP